jgi:hypothetical protein
MKKRPSSKVELMKTFSAFYWVRSSIPVLREGSHSFLSWARYSSALAFLRMDCNCMHLSAPRFLHVMNFRPKFWKHFSLLHSRYVSRLIIPQDFIIAVSLEGITVAALYNTNIFGHSNTGIVVSNAIRGMWIRLPLFFLLLSYECCGLSTGRSPVQGVLQTVYKIYIFSSNIPENLIRQYIVR